jgi:hypothetical protein
MVALKVQCICVKFCFTARKCRRQNLVALLLTRNQTAVLLVEKPISVTSTKNKASQVKHQEGVGDFFDWGGINHLKLVASGQTINQHYY